MSAVGHAEVTSERDSYSQVLDCIKKMELTIRQWVELQKPELMQLSRSHTKAVFNDEKDRLLTHFKNQWAIKVSDCVKHTTDQMKQMIRTVQRRIKTPTDTSEQQMRIMKIMNIRKDAYTCGDEQTDVYDAAIDTLLKEMKNEVPFDTILTQLDPVQDIQPYLERAWKEWVQVYDPKDIQPEVEAAFREVYDKFRTDWSKNSVFCDLVVKMDQPYQISKSLDVFDASKSNSKRIFIFQGPFRSNLQTCYALHKVTLDFYMTTVFPPLVQEWKQQDRKQILDPQRLHRLRSNLDQVMAVYGNTYGEKGTGDTSTHQPTDIPHDAISWLSRVMLFLHTQPTSVVVTASQLEKV